MDGPKPSARPFGIRLLSLRAPADFDSPRSADEHFGDSLEQTEFPPRTDILVAVEPLRRAREPLPIPPPDDNREPLGIREGTSNVEEGGSSGAPSRVDGRPHRSSNLSALTDEVLGVLPANAPGTEPTRARDGAGRGGVIYRCRREIGGYDSPDCDDSENEPSPESHGVPSFRRSREA
jgi:hypothetical protein